MKLKKIKIQTKHNIKKKKYTSLIQPSRQGGRKGNNPNR